MNTRHAHSENQTRIRARFGLPLHDHAQHDRYESLIAHARAAAIELDRALKPGKVALITGPNGSGKSLVVNQLSHICQRPITPLTDLSIEERPPIDLFNCSLNDACRTLAASGLADAHQLVTPANRLSVGQQARLSLALALHHAAQLGKPCTIIADEFASPLDRTTAASLGSCLRRHIEEPIRLIAAAAHDDLIELLAPDVLLYTPIEGTPELLTRESACG
ncbi:MAG: hypothetical protein ED559_00910 [Phycisphaera sp.]|nr:MAG: hypothetical protein ED559_00910 [Phycisphaera sp.]